MAKEFKEIMQDMKEWQEEQKDRVIICFAVSPGDGSHQVMVGNGAGVAAAMALFASKDKETRKLMKVALMAAKMSRAMDDVDDEE